MDDKKMNFSFDEALTEKEKPQEKSARENSYEDDMKRLEEIANHLEKGDLSLKAQLAQFEEAMTLIKRCQTELDLVEARLQQMNDDDTETAIDERH